MDIKAVDILEPVIEEWFPGKVKRTREDFDLDGPGGHVWHDKIEVFSCGKKVASIISERCSYKDPSTWFGITKRARNGTETHSHEIEWEDPEKFDETMEEMRREITKAIKMQRKRFAINWSVLVIQIIAFIAIFAVIAWFQYTLGL